MVDRIDDAFTLFCARFVGKVDHDDPVFHHDPEEHDHPDNGVEGEGLAEEHETDESAKSCWRQRRHDREGREKAFVEDSEDDVDDE